MNYQKTSWLLAGVASALVSQMAVASSADFTSARGSVLIAAPTAVNGPTNQGVWFVNTSTKKFSLELPELESNQVYEGWIVDD